MAGIVQSVLKSILDQEVSLMDYLVTGVFGDSCYKSSTVLQFHVNQD